MTDWLKVLRKLSSVHDGDLRKMALILGKDPSTFYDYQDLGGCDLRGQDLRGMAFTESNLEQALLDDATQIDPEFDPRLSDESLIFSFKVTRDITRLVSELATKYKYKYEGWAYKFLLDRFYGNLFAGESYKIEKAIDSNKYLSSALEFRVRHSLPTRKLTITTDMMNVISSRYDTDDIDYSVNRALLVGMLALKFHPDDESLEFIPINDLL